MGDYYDLFFKVEYVKSGRLFCKVCKFNIGQGFLRLVVMVQVGISFYFVVEIDVDWC